MVMPFGQPPVTGRLVVHCTRNPMQSFFFALRGARVAINGQPMDVGWGQSQFDLPAGNYHLRVSARSFPFEGGPAELPVAVHPGQVTTVYYRPPAMRGIAGSLGFTPQKARGRILLTVGMSVGVLAAVIVLLVTR